MLLISSMGRHDSVRDISAAYAYYTLEKLPGQPWVARVLMLPNTSATLLPGSNGQDKPG